MLIVSLATAQIQAFKLDSATVQALLEFITTESLPRDNRLAVALILKNILKKVYGVSDEKSMRQTLFMSDFQERRNAIGAIYFCFALNFIFVNLSVSNANRSSTKRSLDTTGL